jgi:hypothetical protein
MPYIEKKDRTAIDSGALPRTPGELSYAITRLVQGYMGPERKYSALATVVGVLVLTTVEFIHRVIRPYEDKKILENGDVYFERREKE